MPSDRVLDKYDSDKISFMTFIIPEFAGAFKMKVSQAYRYLKQYGGFDYLNRNWWALHTDNEYHVLLNLYKYCSQNGGYLK
jgi:hypothetical protein